jgi:hypothetical protein
LADIEIDKLAFRVKKRLDEVFPDGEDASEAGRKKRQHLADALLNMRAIAAALQWKVPLRLIQAYARGLASIQPLVADEAHLALLTKVQSELCRHMLDRRHNISPQALMLLMKGFTLMDRLATDPDLSAARRRELVLPFVKTHLTFKQSLAPAWKAAAAKATAAEKPLREGRSRPPAGGLERRAYYLIPVDHVDELRRLIQAGFEELGILISQRKQTR